MKLVAIAGVGLIGGSFALALRRAGFRGEIAGVSSPATIAEALQHRIIDREMTLADAAQHADLLLLAPSIRRILTMLPELAPTLGAHTLVTDVGSTKSLICRTAAACLPPHQFLGGHPMAGKETRGAAASDASLFQGRTWVLTDDRPHPFLDWLRKIGARLLFLDPDTHDRTVAYTSHLPQLLSTALAGVVADSQVTAQAGGPGLIDMTRLALSPFDIWDDILATNPAAIDDALLAAITRLQAIRNRLATAGVADDFAKGAAFRRQLTPSVNLR